MSAYLALALYLTVGMPLIVVFDWWLFVGSER